MPPAPGPPRMVASVHREAVVGKTTATAYTLHACAEHGWSDRAVDADPQASLANWATAANWHIPVEARPDARLHHDLPEVVGYDTLIVDTPGTVHGRPIILSALRAATHVLIPTAPSPLEYDQLKPMR